MTEKDLHFLYMIWFYESYNFREWIELVARNTEKYEMRFKK